MPPRGRWNESFRSPRPMLWRGLELANPDGVDVQRKSSALRRKLRSVRRPVPMSRLPLPCSTDTSDSHQGDTTPVGDRFKKSVLAVRAFGLAFKMVPKGPQRLHALHALTKNIQRDRGLRRTTPKAISAIPPSTRLEGSGTLNVSRRSTPSCLFRINTSPVH